MRIFFFVQEKRIAGGLVGWVCACLWIFEVSGLVGCLKIICSVGTRWAGKWLGYFFLHFASVGEVRGSKEVGGGGWFDFIRAKFKSK